MRWLAPGGRDDALDRVGRHAQVERHEDRGRPASPRSRSPAARAWTATRSGGGRPARGRARAGATRRAGERRSSSRYVQVVVEPSSRRRLSAVRRRSASTASVEQVQQGRSSVRAGSRASVRRHTGAVAPDTPLSSTGPSCSTERRGRPGRPLRPDRRGSDEHRRQASTYAAIAERATVDRLPVVSPSWKTERVPHRQADVRRRQARRGRARGHLEGSLELARPKVLDRLLDARRHASHSIGPSAVLASCLHERDSLRRSAVDTSFAILGERG